MSAKPEHEVLIVGGGLAGPAAAILLARAGRRVVLLERELQPHHKVCGEFLSQEALGYLCGLGVDVAALGAVPIHTVGIAGVDRKLPFAAMSLTRCALDEALLRTAVAAGVTVLRGCHVQQLDRDGNAWRATLQDGTSLSAKTAFVATGKHNLRGRPRPAGKQAGLVAFKMYFRLSAEQTASLAGRVELILYRGGYAGLQPVEGGVANLCCLIQRDELQRLGGDWPSLLTAMRQQCPELRERLAGAVPTLSKPLAITAIPYGYVREATEEGFWSLGDQAAVIPSFTGDGMSIALHSGCLAATMYLQGTSSTAFQRRLHKQLNRQVSLATWVSRSLVWPPARALVTTSVKLWPGLLSLMATQTRIANKSILLRS